MSYQTSHEFQPSWVDSLVGIRHETHESKQLNLSVILKPLYHTKQNAAPKPGPGIIGAQAIALQVVGDQIAFHGCGMYGYQDTLNDHQGRHFFRECYIEGMVDFIFGNARSLFVVLHKARIK